MNLEVNNKECRIQKDLSEVGNNNDKKNYYNLNMREYWDNKDRKKILLNLTEDDKFKLMQLDSWAYKAFELTILERIEYRQAPLRGEIWSMDLGINVGDEMDKVRPCIIVSYDSFNEKAKLCTVVPITHSDCTHQTQFTVDENIIDYSESIINGTAKAEQIVTKSKARLGRKIGKLNEKGLALLNKAILVHLGLS